MSKKSISKERSEPTHSPNEHCRDNLTRRPINKNSENLKERTDKYSEKYKRLYPEVPFENEENESDSSEGEESHKEEASSFQENIVKRIYEYLFYIKYIILFFFVCLFVRLYFGNSKSNEKTEIVVSVTELINGMQNHFKKQHKLTYRILKSELKKVVDVTFEPSAPAIITVLASRGAESTASEFSQHLVQELNPKRYLLINDTTYWQDHPDKIMLKIDNEIKTFPRDHLNIIVIDKVERIPAKAAMIFHSYCDHESAPYKRAIFLFVVATNEIIPDDADTKYIDKIAMKRFRNIWQEASDDEIDSLITRITVAVISVS